MSDESPIRGTLRFWPTLRLAWRNLSRSRTRTWITATTVAFAVLLLQVMMALMIGIERQSFDNLINYQTGHAKLYAAGYFEEREDLPLDYMLTGVDAIVEEVRRVDGVAAATSRIVFSAQLSNGIDQIPCFGTGIRTSGDDADVFRLRQAIVDGSYLQSGEEGMLIGMGLAKYFGVSTGDWLTVLTKTRAGAYEALDLPIVGLLGTGNPLIDQSSFLVPLETARYMLDVEGAGTEVAVRFSAASRESAVLRNLTDSFESAGIVVKGWRDVEEDFIALVQTKRVGQAIFLMIFVIMAVVGITNTILMASFERTREIGTLMAMGLRPGGIRKIFLVEGALTGLLGGAIGSAVALAFIAWLMQSTATWISGIRSRISSTRDSVLGRFC